NMARIFGGLGEKGSDIPKRSRVKRLESVESKRDVRRGACGDQPASSKAHSEAAGAQRQPLVIRQRWNDVNKSKLKVDWIILNGRSGLRFTFNQAGDALGKEPDALAEVKVSEECDP